MPNLLPTRTPLKRDIWQWLTAGAISTAACFFLYTLYGFIFVQFQAHSISKEMKLFEFHAMFPLIQSNDPCIISLPAQFGSALFFGFSLGALVSVAGILISVWFWVRRKLSWIDIFWFLLFAIFATYFGLSLEHPIISTIFGLLSPFVFFIPWILCMNRSRRRRVSYTRWLVFFIVLVLPVLIIRPVSFEYMRDTMLEIPVIRSLSTFYYEHTLLAADVIKPAAYKTQKAIAVSSGINKILERPHGTLWIISDDPCSIAGTSLVISSISQKCDSFYVPDSPILDDSRQIIQKASSKIDYNRFMRAGIRNSLLVGLPCLALFFIIWIALGLSLFSKRMLSLAVVFGVVYLICFMPGIFGAFWEYELNDKPDKIHEYILSGHETKRYLVLVHYPESLSTKELIWYCQDPSARVRLRALIEMGERRDRAFLGALSKAVNDPQLNVRTKACWALGNIRGLVSHRLLQSVLKNDPSWYVREYAYRAIGRIRPINKVVVE